MDERLLTDDAHSSPDASPLREGMAFVAENPEAFGFISDAYPVVTDEWMMAAHGRESEAGVASFTFPAVGGAEGLYEHVFADILQPDKLTTAMLTHTFGKETARREHPIARYVAALTEAVTLKAVSGPLGEASCEEVASRLGKAIPRALAALRENLCSDGLTARQSELYAVSMALCRMKRTGNGQYTLDLFSAGDYRVYLLDAAGLRPLWLTPTPGLSPDAAVEPPAAKRVILRHPSPFAVLLLSDSACATGTAERQRLKQNPGLVWHYRMRMEANILRILTALSKETDFGERAGRFFTGRASGRESASGALLMRCGKVPFDAFRADCLTRLRHVEDMLALLPDGYNPAKVPSLPSRTETETAYIRRLLSQEQGLPERVTDALRALALDRLTAETAESVPLPEDVPDLRRLTREDVTEAFRIYDAENAEDYAHIRRNRATLREQLSDHWVTLRPILLAVSRELHDPPPPVATEEPEDESLAEDLSAVSGEDEISPAPTDTPADRAYASLLRLNARLGGLWRERLACRDALAAHLDAHTAILRSMGEDWLHARAGMEDAPRWADTAAGELSDALRDLANTYERTETEYRSLLSAYMAERDLLFRRDAETPGGAFYTDWTAMLDGTMTERHRVAFRGAILDDPSADGYVKLWDDLCVISRGTSARLSRVHDRAADRRMARDIAGRAEIRIAALRASAYRDTDWGEAVCDLLDTAHRNSYFTMVRRWQETCELMQRQAAAYEEYRVLYEGVR